MDQTEECGAYAIGCGEGDRPSVACGGGTAIGVVRAQLEFDLSGTAARKCVVEASAIINATIYARVQSEVMIRVWLSRTSSIPLREQLSAQLILGMLSRRLAPGDRLPSVRELARRLKVHSNTVSAAYCDLAERGWVSRRPGSGVFVRGLEMPKPDGGVEAFVRAWVEDGLGRGFAFKELESALRKIGQEAQHLTAAHRLLVVHSDRELAAILAREIADGVGSPVASADFADAAALLSAGTCVLVTAACEAQTLRELAPAQYRVIRLKPMEDVIAGQSHPGAASLIAIVSRSESIRHWSSTLLAALGLPGMDVLPRNPADVGWQKGLGACDVVAADVVSILELPKGLKATAFKIVSDEFLADARELVTVKKA